ncbi:glucose-6-phosphate isomerase [Gordonia araii NBRC 100433]|uniref:Glucose-6-phosphate isomerase n=1 Tax=Gordonia araii NBRC 100433 TaxID=1073574 RepID=G7H3H5_9ACTN|nr:glucose-6-phosphate isomerase [Gordonia araii]NNG96518.1 glucose-6-phosphate isomerase [Gordonia araii NBRC 100433]GAB10400.1 glucose-6-phosphate isomerase [Gordonia araii NBRC 100433]
MSDVTATQSWHALAGHQPHVFATTLRELFALDPGRGSDLVVDAGDLHIDYSKNRVTRETLELLFSLAREVGLEEQRDAMFAGEHINTSEDRAVLHTALRLPRSAVLTVDGRDAVADVHRVLDAMGRFTDDVRSGAWLGFTGQKITDVVNIGIGGSDLGPEMVTRALRDYHDGPATHFVSNVDPADILATLDAVDPATTLFVISSKTFTTLETLSNARAARTWLVEALGDDAAVARHFVAVSTNAAAVREFGIDESNMFEFWDWVGGRYSVDSAIGLSVMLAVGKDGFAEFLDGFRTIDEHFATAPLERNAPAILGLLAVWYDNFFDAGNRAVLPYSNDLARFTAYLQQLAMESNGKSVTRDGHPVTCDTGQVWWGEPGTNGQHAFFQLLHQGTRMIPADFIAFARPFRDVTTEDGTSMHDLLISNVLAQTKVLAFGKTAEDIAAEGVDPDLVAHKVMPGNRPSTTIFAPKLTPGTLGQLIALYEHQVFVEGTIWDIDSFDQWGVELGKAAAIELLEPLTSTAPPQPAGDSSTDALVSWYRAQAGRRV